MTDVVSLAAVFCDTCRLGMFCPDARCGLFHPQGWNYRRNVNCPNLGNCRRWACQHRHPRGHAPLDRADCEKGLECPSKLCACRHPSTWDWRKNAECPATTCYDRACVYKHTTGQKLCQCVQCHLEKEPGLLHEGNNFCSEDCKTNYLADQVVRRCYPYGAHGYGGGYDYYDDGYDGYNDDYDDDRYSYESYRTDDSYYRRGRRRRYYD